MECPDRKTFKIRVGSRRGQEISYCCCTSPREDCPIDNEYEYGVRYGYESVDHDNDGDRQRLRSSYLTGRPRFIWGDQSTALDKLDEAVQGVLWDPPDSEGCEVDTSSFIKSGWI